MSQLLPCPFCGGEAIRTALKIAEMVHAEKRVECMKCEAQTAPFGNYGDAQKAWNKRYQK